MRGHVLRSGSRKSDNSSGEMKDIVEVLSSIKKQACSNSLLTSTYQILIAFDIVCRDADEEKKKELQRVVSRYMTGFRIRFRISSRSLGVAQTDSLLSTCQWIQLVAPSPVLSGVLFLRADSVMKEKFDPYAWILRGVCTK